MKAWKFGSQSMGKWYSCMTVVTPLVFVISGSGNHRTFRGSGRAERVGKKERGPPENVTFDAGVLKDKDPRGQNNFVVGPT